MRAPRTSHAPDRRGRVVAALLAILTLSMLVTTSCGLPRSGTVRTVDGAEVPYHLLEPDSAASPRAASGGTAKAPVVMWVAGQHLVPEATDSDCEGPPEAVVDELLSALTAGPSDETRSDGRSSAVPSDFGLELSDVSGGTAVVSIDPTTSTSAEQLPIAVGQIVLTVTSAPEVRSVVLVSDGAPVQVPLPTGVLVDEPVTAQDYAELLPARLRSEGALGCLRP